MASIESLLFVLCFTVIPLAMIVLLARFAIRGLRERRARSALRSEGWSPVSLDDPALREALEDLSLTPEPARIQDRSKLDEEDDPLFFVRHRNRGTAQQRRSSEVWLIARRGAPGPVGAVNVRNGGLAERALLGALGPGIEPPGWEWAMVSGPTPREGWSPAVGAALAEVLRPGERLRLSPGHIGLVAPDHVSRAARMREARDRVNALRAALGAGS